MHPEAYKNTVSRTHLNWKSKCDSEKHKIRIVIFQTFCLCENHDEFEFWDSKVYRRTNHHWVDLDSPRQLHTTIAPICKIAQSQPTNFSSGAKKCSKWSFWAYKLCCDFTVKEDLHLIYKLRNLHCERFSRQSEKWPKKSSKCLIISIASMDVHKWVGYQRNTSFVLHLP